jgi:hypothetical protein
MGERKKRGFWGEKGEGAAFQNPVFCKGAIRRYAYMFIASLKSTKNLRRRLLSN